MTDTYRPPSIADGTVAEALVQDLRDLADTYGAAGVASTVRELWPELGGLPEPEIRRQGALASLAMLCADDVFDLGHLPDPTGYLAGERAAQVRSVVDVYDALLDVIERGDLLTPISEASTPDGSVT